MKKITLLVFLMILMVISLPLEARRYGRNPYTRQPLQNQSFNIKLGLFQPNMQSELWDINMENLALNEQDMQNISFALEYEQFFNRVMSFSIEGTHYSREHNSQYTEYEYEDGSPIYQSLALTINSLELNLKIYPLGHHQAFSPFLGGGIGIYYWKYEQWGDFINFLDGSVEEGYADTRTYTPAFNARAGFTFKAWRSTGLSFEVKYQFLKGSLSSLFEDFDKLDMSGWIFNFGVNLFF